VDFVSGLENEGRKVTEFLGLQWHPDQSAFHENARKNSATLPPITTSHGPFIKELSVAGSVTLPRWSPIRNHSRPTVGRSDMTVEAPDFMARPRGFFELER